MDAPRTIERRASGSDRADTRLLRIAAATGMPIAAFFSADGPADRPSLLDLIRSWDAIGDDSGRERVLASARAVAGERRGA